MLHTNTNKDHSGFNVCEVIKWRTLKNLRYNIHKQHSQQPCFATASFERWWNTTKSTHSDYATLMLLQASTIEQQFPLEQKIPSILFSALLKNNVSKYLFVFPPYPRYPSLSINYNSSELLINHSMVSSMKTMHLLILQGIFV